MSNPEWLKVAESLESGYKQNNIGWLLYSLVRAYKPVRCVEIGVLHGYSTMFIGGALLDNEIGQLDAFDLWAEYPYRHTTLPQTWENVERAGLAHIVALYQDEAALVPERLKLPVDFVHIDISNTGETYAWAASVFYNLLSPDGLMVMEGGTYQRDQVEWRLKYDKTPIQPAIQDIKNRGRWEVFVFEPFPGLTVMKKCKVN